MTWRVVLLGMLCAAAPFADAGQADHAPPAGVLHPRRETREVPLVDGHDLQFRRLTAEGLSRTRVAQIAQDQTGFMWFGTARGLYRYDGNELRAFRQNARPPHRLSGVWVHSLLNDRSGTLWVGSDSALDRFDPRSDTFRPQLIASASEQAAPMKVSAMTRDTAGMLWLGTPSGLYRVDPGTSQTTSVRHRPGDSTSLAHDAIQWLGEDRRGGLWIGTAAGLDLFDRTSQQVVLHLPLSESRNGMAFHEDRFGTFWIIHGTEGELAVFDRAANTLSTRRPSVNQADAGRVMFTTMLEDRDGTMWFGTVNDGVLKFDRDRERFIRYTDNPSVPSSLSDRRVNTLYQDREGLIWAGLHQSEPNYFLPHPPAFQRLQPGGRQSGLVSAILQDRSGLVWLGLDRGMQTLDRKMWAYRELPGLQAEETTSIVESAPGTFWIGTAGQGLRQFDQKTGRIRTFRHQPGRSSSLPSDFVEQVKQAGDGSVWAVTWSGLARWEPVHERFVTVRPLDAPQELTFHTATFARNGTIWIGSNLGVHRFDPATQRFEWFRHDDADSASLSNDRVNSIHQGADGSLWLGTQSGLDHWDSNGRPLGHYTQDDGLSGHTVSCILEDEARQLWMSTERGISRLDTSTWEFTTYDTADGLPGVNMTGWDSCARAPSGEMFFAGFAGATAFFPQRIAARFYVPPAVLTRFRLLDSAFDVDGARVPELPVGARSEIQLLPSQGKFSVEFAALSFLSPETNRLRYRLHGLQEEWTEVRGGQRSATYMALPPGSYSFQAQAATRYGPWSPSTATLRIVMLPPWWRTWPFYAAATVVVAAALLVAYRLRMRQLTHAYNVRLEERWAERSRIARELHDTLLQGFQGLMFRLQAVRDLLPLQPAKAIPVLDTALLTGEAAIDEARNAVSGLRSADKVDRDFDAGLVALAAAAAQASRDVAPPNWEVVTKGRVREVPKTVLYELYQVAQEAISNAFRHARARHIIVEVRYGIGGLCLTVSDDGVGCEDPLAASTRAPGHFGVQGMRERVERLGGHMALRSRPHEGTAVMVSVPAPVAYGHGALLSRAAAFLSGKTPFRRRSYE